MNAEYALPHRISETPLEEKWRVTTERLKVFDVLEPAKEIWDTFRPGETVLDGGCGDARLSFRLKNEKCVNVYGIDVSREKINQAKGRFQNEKFMLPDFEVGNCAETRFQDNFFDRILLSGILGLVEPWRQEEMLLEMIRILKPTGTLIIVDYAFDPKRMKQYTDDQYLTGAFGTIQARDSEGNHLFQPTHFPPKRVEELYKNAGFDKSSIHIIQQEGIEAVAVEGTNPKKRPQFSATARKPFAKRSEVLNLELIAH